MQKYALGFAFNPSLKKVVLIRKNRPDWQAGHLNGVGGHIEEGENPHDAMVREFQEETGVKIDKWHQFARCSSHGVELYCFRTILPSINKVKTTTEEEVVIFKTADILKNNELINSVRWMVPLAMHDKSILPVEFILSGTPVDYRFDKSELTTEEKFTTNATE